MYEIADQDTPITETVIRQLHHLIVQRSKPDIAGQYTTIKQGIAGSTVVYPSSFEVPALMRDFGERLQRAEPSPREAFGAHYRLVTIHPFTDGKGRTARLFMNLMLVRGGYRPVAVRPEDRSEYLTALERAQLGGNLEPFLLLMNRRLEQTMAAYVGVVGEAIRTTTAIENEREGGKRGVGTRPKAAQAAYLEDLKRRGLA